MQPIRRRQSAQPCRQPGRGNPVSGGALLSRGGNQPIPVGISAAGGGGAAIPRRRCSPSRSAISPSLSATRARESGFGGGAAIPRRQSAHPGRHISPSGSAIPRAAMPMQPIRVGRQSHPPNLDGRCSPSGFAAARRCYPAGNHQPIRVGNHPGRGNPVSGGRCYPAAAISPSLTAISPSGSAIPRAAMPMQPIRVGNQPILDGNQGAGIRSLLSRGGNQPIRVGNPAGCYADAAHPARQSAHPRQHPPVGLLSADAAHPGATRGAGIRHSGGGVLSRGIAAQP